MKRFLSILLLVAFLLPQLTKLCVIIDFKINQDFIAKVLCINKDNPASKCNGKCYLSKQLKDIEKQEKEKSPNNLLKKLATSLYIYVQESSTLPLFNIPKDLTKNIFFEIPRLYISSYIDEIFHPPQLTLI